MTDYKSCGYTIQTELINLRIICVSSGDLSHILNELIHSAGPVKGSHVKPEKTQHMTEGLYVSHWLPLRVKKVSTLKTPN